MKRLIRTVAVLALIIAMSLTAYAQEREDTPAVPEWDAVIEEFIAENNMNPNSIALGYYNTVTGEERYYRGDVEITAASTTKVPLNMYFAEKLHNGEIDWDTTYDGLTYEKVQELVIRYSNNEYAEVLKKAIGSYPDFRRAICPYIGVDPDSREFSFFTVNQLSTEQAIYCLKMLYNEPERFPGVIDNMLLANEGDYFKEFVSEYDIAQKFGWYVPDAHEYVGCIGIVWTEQPILLAILTDNCSMRTDVLGAYCSLMCNYVEETIAVQKAAEAKAAAEAEAQRLAEEEAAREKEHARLEAEEAEREENLKNQETVVEIPEPESSDAVRVVACIVACALLIIPLGLVFRKKTQCDEGETSNGRQLVSGILILLTAAVTVFTVFVCGYAMNAKPVIMNDSSDPAICAEEFLSLVLSGDVQQAETMLLGSGKLGLDSSGNSELARMFYDALFESFSFEKLGICEKSGIEAQQSFLVTYLDIPSITAFQREATNAKLAKYLDEAERYDDVLTEDGAFRSEVAIRALEEATEELLENAKEHYVLTELTIEMQYSDGEWKIVANDTLSTILSGGTAN